MNKKPVLLRSLFALLVIAVFAFSMFPLGQRDFFDTFRASCVNPSDPKVDELVRLSREIKAQSKEVMSYDSSAMEEAASRIEKKLALSTKDFSKNGKYLLDFVNPVLKKNQKMTNNRDVIAHVRKMSAGSVRLGIDLHGGVEFLLELEPQEGGKGSKRAKEIQENFNRYRDITIENLRSRIEGLNIFESEITPAGGNLISLRVPTNSKEEKVKLRRLIELSARLTFNLVHKENASLVAEYLKNPAGFKAPDGYVLMESVESDGPRGKAVYIVERDAQMDGHNIVNAFVSMTQFGQREIILNFNAEGAARFGQVTGSNVGRELAIILDGQLYSAPRINQAIPGGNAQITGSFSREDAENISNALVSGSVPFKVRTMAQYDIAPTLGEETVKAGIVSGILGTILVMLFMLFYYGKTGIIADISLVVNALLMLGAIAAFNVTLTLPGVAGIILTIGMAVDANVLFNERIREEFANGKNLLNAVNQGFDKAFWAVFDSNITTLFVAMILLWRGTGAIKGFAMTLAIGIFTTLFTAVFLTHLLFDLMMRFCPPQKLSMRSFLPQTVKIDFVGFRKIAYGFSVLLIVCVIAVVAIRGKDVLSIDFTGGTQIELNYQKAIPAEEIASALTKAGYEARVVYKSSGTAGDKGTLEILVRSAKKGVSASKDEMTKVTGLLNRTFKDAGYTGSKQSTLGAVIGDTFMKSALISLIIAILGMIFYMTLRFQFSYSIAANVALLHDIVFACGLYIMFGGQLTMNTVAAALTILGYSVNDTIVNYDRIRENLKLMKGSTYRQVINVSVNQMLARAILTSFTTSLVLIMQLIFGGSGIRDFVTVMLIGVAVGVYSSMFIAPAIVEAWHNKAEGIENKAAER